MRRLFLFLALVAGTSGCFVVLGNPFDFGRRHPLDETTLEGKGRAKILLVDVSGVITDQPSKRAFGLVETEGTVSRIKSELEKAADDSRVKAVVLRINSPGGGVTASDEIYAELRRFKRKEELPIVAAFGDVAASGGYYVACAADTIVAAPTTVTGSIGVILMNLNLEGLLGKIGIRNETYKAGAHKDLLSPFRGATPEERRIVQGIMDDLHARFIAVVNEGRGAHLDRDHLPDLTDGRIFDASQALRAGLVDQIGSLRDAIDVAKKAAGVEEARVVTYHRPDETRENIYSRLARGGTSGAAGGMQVNVLPLELDALSGGPRFMYLWAPGLVE